MYVRTWPGDGKRLLRERDLPALDAAWVRHRLDQLYVSWALDLVGDDGLSRVQAELLAKHGQANARDIYWVVAARVQAGAAARADWETAHGVSVAWASLAYEAGEPHVAI